MKIKTLRRMRMGLQTVLGWRRQGFFTPYRYADTVTEPQSYPGLEGLFHAAESRMQDILDEIDAAKAELAALDGPPPLPRWDQSWFPRLDGAAAHAIVRRAGPARIVEVGSGHSTRMLASAAPKAAIICIDPAPRAALPPGVVHEARVLSERDLPSFEALGTGDIAFFDSSHILWPGTDVDIILNRILPMLSPGVLIHIHDITLPDPYPPEWAWRGYTEQNGLAGWLHGACEIVFSSHYAMTRMNAAAQPGLRDLPFPEGARETSLWLHRC